MTRRRLHSMETVTRTAILVWVLTSLACCIREPELHLFDGGEMELDLPMVNLELDAYWNYEIGYDWRAQWVYGWDDDDQQIFGEIGYTKPTAFNLRRYFTGTVPEGTHSSVLANTVVGNSFQGQYSWGYWDILVWNEVSSIDGVQSLNFDEQASLDSVVAYTNPSMAAARYQAPAHSRAFYEPDALFSAYDRGVEIDRSLEGFEFDSINNVYVKKLDMVLEPITYIYLTQVIIHNNRNKIVGVDGSANLSGLARTTVVNTGRAGDDLVTVHFNTRFKTGCNMNGETVDVAGGRLLTFGMAGQNANRIKSADEVNDKTPHYLDMTMQFNNGMDTTFVFDVTQQVRKRWRGGVITVELDMDTVGIPSRNGGSAFDAVVKDFEKETHEFDL